ncbi:hypothetical protein L6164_005552 [Bauhinia variegata]|uniref:Uncharacterized protein n=1 Tax=Bauhinia variegata TaxID=167791 RepID=A0ACB9PRI7_BAUVA|nr:hypothetical protein L6164_005552 [Bauhinia variegata]
MEAYLEEMREAQRARGPATVLAIGTANPSNFIYQSDFTDYYFRVTNSNHLPHLRAKLNRICEKSMIRKRHMFLTEEMLKENPKMSTYAEPSLNARHDMLIEEVPKLGEKAASKAIKEWGRPKSDITHLIFCSISSVDTPGADYKLVNLLGLNPSVKRFMLYQQGCYAGGTVLRLAKDLTENNAGARVLVVCSEMTVVSFRGPCETQFDNMLGQALFADGASAAIISASPLPVERSLFHVVSAKQTILPNSEGAITGHLREEGLTFTLKGNVPQIVSDNIEKSLEETFNPI